METREAMIELERGLRAFKAFEKAAEVVAFVAGLEQRVRELQAQIATEETNLAAAVKKANDEISALRVQVEDEKRRAARAKAGAEAAGVAEIQKAQAEAARILDEAKARAAATEERAGKVAAFAREIESTISARQVELATIEQKLTAAREQIAKLLG